MRSGHSPILVSRAKKSVDFKAQVTHLNECCQALVKTSPLWPAEGDEGLVSATGKGGRALMRYWLDKSTTGGSILFWSGYYSQLPNEVKETFEAFADQQSSLAGPSL